MARDYIRLILRMVGVATLFALPLAVAVEAGGISEGMAVAIMCIVSAAIIVPPSVRYVFAERKHAAEEPAP